MLRTETLISSCFNKGWQNDKLKEAYEDNYGFLMNGMAPLEYSIALLGSRNPFTKYKAAHSVHFLKCRIPFAAVVFSRPFSALFTLTFEADLILSVLKGQVYS